MVEEKQNRIKLNPLRLRISSREMQIKDWWLLVKSMISYFYSITALFKEDQYFLILRTLNVRKIIQLV
jgi:hypothetical protein